MSWLGDGSALLDASSGFVPGGNWFGSGGGTSAPPGLSPQVAALFSQLGLLPGTSSIVNAGAPSASSGASGLVPYQAPGGGGDGSMGLSPNAPSVSFADMTGPQQAATQSLNTNPVTSFVSALMSGSLPGAIGALPGMLGVNAGPLGNMAISTALGKAASLAGVPGLSNPASFLTSLAKMAMNMNGQNAIADSMHNDAMQGFGPNDATPSFSLPGTEAEGLGIQGLSPNAFSPTFNMVSTLANMSPAQAVAFAQAALQGLSPTGLPGFFGRSGNSGQAGGVGLTGQEGLTSLNFNGQLGPTNRSDDPDGDGPGGNGPGAGNSGNGPGGVGGPGGPGASGSPSGVGGEASGGPAGDGSSSGGTGGTGSGGGPGGGDSGD